MPQPREPTDPQTPLDLARERLRNRTWEPTPTRWQSLNRFARDYWDDIRRLPFLPVVLGGLALTGVTGLAVLNDKHRSLWITIALIVVIIIQLAVAFRRDAPRSRAARLRHIDEMIEEGVRLLSDIRNYRQVPHNVLNPTHPDQGHPDAIRAADFQARAYAVLPPSFGWDTLAAVTSAVDAYRQRLAEATDREAEAAEREGREAQPIYDWPWPLMVEATLDVLSAASKEIRKAN